MVPGTSKTPSGADPSARSPADEFNAAVTAVTNAFGDPTRREIYLFVRDDGARGVTAPSRRRALRAAPERRPPPPREARPVAATSFVEVGRRETDTAVRTAGRPSKRYCAVQLDSTLSLPLKHDDVLAGLLARALDALGPDEADALADDVGYEYGDAARRADGPDRRPPLGARRARRRRRRAHRTRVRRARRRRTAASSASCRSAARSARPRTRYPHVVCALDRGMIRGHARRPLRRDVAAVRGEPARRRRPLRRPRLTTGPRWPAPTSTTRRRRRCVPRRSTRCSRTSRGHPGDPGRLHHEGLGPRASRSSRRASRSRRCSAPARARSCSRRRAPRRSNTAICGAVARAREQAGAPAHRDHRRRALGGARRGTPRRRRRHRGRRRPRRSVRPPPTCSRRIDADTALVSIQLANHEVGTVQHGAAVIVAARRRAGRARARRRLRGGRAPPGRLPRARRRPVLGERPQAGVGRRAPPRSSCAGACGSRRFVVGGAQERARRGGIEDVPAIVGFGAAAAELADDGRARRARPPPPVRRTDALAAAAVAVDGVIRFGDSGRRASPTWCASASPASRPSRSCSASTSTAWPCTPARRARARRSSRRRCSQAMGVDADRSLRVSVGWTHDRRRRRGVRGGVPGNRRAPRRGLRTHDPGHHGINHAVLYVRDADARPTSTRTRSASRSSTEIPGTAAFLRAARHRQPPRPRPVLRRRRRRAGRRAAAASGSTTSRGRSPTIEDLVAAARRSCCELGALRRRERPRRHQVAVRQGPRRQRVRGDVDASRARQWGDYEHHAIVAPLDLDAELARHSASGARPVGARHARTATGPPSPATLVDDAAPRARPRSRSRSASAPPEGVAPFDDADAARPLPDGRTGRVPAGCVFWMQGGRAHVHHRRRGPRQLQRRQPDARVQDARRGRRATPTSPRCSSRAG